jgi:hypothetical protein
MLPATKQTFEEYFENGLSPPSEAIQHHEAIFLEDLKVSVCAKSC